MFMRYNCIIPSKRLKAVQCLVCVRLVWIGGTVGIAVFHIYIYIYRYNIGITQIWTQWFLFDYIYDDDDDDDDGDDDIAKHKRAE